MVHWNLKRMKNTVNKFRELKMKALQVFTAIATLAVSGSTFAWWGPFDNNDRYDNRWNNGRWGDNNWNNNRWNNRWDNNAFGDMMSDVMGDMSGDMDGRRDQVQDQGERQRRR